MEKFSLLSFGCKINQYEGHKIKEKFLRMGLEETDRLEEASVCLVNTCSVTARADQKTRKFLRKIHSQNPEVLIIVTGCYGTAKADREELLSLPGVRYVVSNYEKMDIPKLYAEHTGRNYPEREVSLSPFSTDRTRVYLKIQDGCNLMCTFCKIPYVRNQIISKEPQEVIREAQEYAEQGFKEIVLTGVHLGLYGWRKADSHQYSLPDLMGKLVEVPGLERLRLSSIEANEITPELIEVARGSSKVCPHFHIPLQSGNDRILKLMNRQYSLEEFLEKVLMLQEELDRPGLTTDVIYGFPTESESEFEDTLKVIETVGFHRVHGFPFSPRRRTPAYRMEPKVSPLEMKKRKGLLLETSYRQSEKYKRAFVGQKERVLLESNFDSDRAMFSGYTDRYLKCYIPGGEGWQNRLFDVEIAEVTEDGVVGKRVN